jgi:hypothetical protein
MRQMGFAVAAVVAAILLATPGFAAAAGRELLARNDIWKFHDGGTDLGTAWRLPSFDDATWKYGTAPFGFGLEHSSIDPCLPLATVLSPGPRPGSRHPTVYFRARFDVPSLPSGTKVKLYLHVDDGAVVYVNGVEANRLGFDASLVPTHGSYAGGDAGEAWVDLPGSLFVRGRNLVAVEVHQDSHDSPELWFELGLTVRDGSPRGATFQPVALQGRGPLRVGRGRPRWRSSRRSRSRQRQR